MTIPFRNRPIEALVTALLAIVLFAFVYWVGGTLGVEKQVWNADHTSVQYVEQPGAAVIIPATLLLSTTLVCTAIAFFIIAAAALVRRWSAA